MLGILLQATVVKGIFEDQAGQRDWKRENIGNIKSAVFQARRVFVSTDSNVVAALGIKSGKIEWRHVLPAGKIVSVVFVDVLSLF